MVFDKNWFQQNNEKLCYLANHKVLKYWFRRLLCIHKDIKWSDTINQITPNSFTYNGKIKGDKIELTTDFRTHEKFGKRLYYGLKPLWYVLHFWDWSTAIQPALNCGFDTLTVYPDYNGKAGATSCDGSSERSGVDDFYSTIRAGAGTASSSSETSGTYVEFLCSATSNRWAKLKRSIFLFDTSSLTAGATISASVLSLYGSAKNDGLGATPDIGILTSTPTSDTSLANGDYSQLGTTLQHDSAITYSSWSITGYNDFTFNATGIGNVSKTSISKFGARVSKYDATNDNPLNYISWSSGVGFSMSGYYSDETGTLTDPKLVITYTLPASKGNFFMLFN